MRGLTAGGPRPMPGSVRFSQGNAQVSSGRSAGVIESLRA